MAAAAPLAMEFGRRGPLRGTLSVPGDKSISHRALMLAAVASGTSRLTGLSPGEDVAATRRALAALGVGMRRDGAALLVDGVGTGGLAQPAGALDMGNSGTSARLLMGLVASHPIRAVFVGDTSLSSRPMGRVATPLRQIGAKVYETRPGRLPLTIAGTDNAIGREHQLDIASAQVKSALLLAGLNASGVTTLREPRPTRDHLERMLPLFGADIRMSDEAIRLGGEADLRGADLHVPGDPSSAAFFAVAAALVPGSDIRIEGVCANPRRTGLFDALKRMGADISWQNRRIAHGEPVADLHVRHAPLVGARFAAADVPAMIDEYPILFVAAALAEGESVAEGLAELRVKESDRLAAMAAGLRAIGARVEEGADRVRIVGSGGRLLAGGGRIASRLDHRIAMSFAVAGLACAEPLGIDDMTPVSTSFPGFVAALDALSPPDGIAA